METIQQSFTAHYNFDIVFTNNLFSVKNKTFSHLLDGKSSNTLTKIVFVIDKGCLKHHLDITEHIELYFKKNLPDYHLCLPFLDIEGGEIAKNTAKSLYQVLKTINTHKVDRHSFLIAIGGGAVLDLVGFAAAIGHRGIHHIRIPTTVLSQNDSGIGVKNGINFFNKKNFLGSFAPPHAVINDSEFLTTLNDRDWRSGIAEAIKVALIKDAVFFDWIAANAVLLNTRDLPTMEILIYRCAKLHAMHISTSGDPFEKGSSRPLDFGHWAAHKLEQLTNFSLKHGEAVAIGMALDVTYAHTIGFISSEDLKVILECLIQLGFDICHPTLFSKNLSGINPELLKGLDEFREHLGGALTIMLISAIGVGKEVHQIDYKMLNQSVLMLNQKSSLYAYHK